MPAAGRQPAGVVGLSPTAPAWRTHLRHPDVMGTDDIQITQLVGRDHMRRMPFTGGGLAIERFAAHALHEGATCLSPTV